MTLGERIKSIRGRMGIDAKDAAERAGISPTTWSRIENGRMQPTSATIEKMAVGLGVSAVTLWGGPAAASASHVVLSEFERAVVMMLRTYSAEQQRDVLARLMLLGREEAAAELRPRIGDEVAVH